MDPRTKAEAVAAGKTHLRLRCGCKTVDVPWQLLPAYPDDVPLHLFARKMRCKDRCKEPPKVIGSVGPDDARRERIEDGHKPLTGTVV